MSTVTVANDKPVKDIQATMSVYYRAVQFRIERYAKLMLFCVSSFCPASPPDERKAKDIPERVTGTNSLAGDHRP